MSAFAQPAKIACVGNSITEGSGIPDKVNDSWPAQLQKLLGDEYTVLNAGHSGRTMLKKGDFPLWVEPAFKNAVEMVPDIVFILLGTNDSKPWNWEFKNEFVPDYLSMIDTFRVVNPDVQIYACLPPPAFSVQWGIRDSVITTDQIPMLRHIADSVQVDTVDFYTPFIERNALFPDDIHPNAEGSWEMAKVAYKTMTGNDVTQIQDVDVARGKMAVSTSNSLPCDPILDGDWRTGWMCANGGSVDIDLGVVESIDLFVTDFGETGKEFGQYYKIEISTDSTTWNVAVDKTEGADSTLRMAVDRIQPTDARFVRLTLVGPVTGTNETSTVNDVRIFRTAPVHAPAFYIDNIEPKSKFTRFEYFLIPTNDSGYLKAVRSSNLDDPFLDLKGYRTSELQSGMASVRPENVIRYFTKAYVDGVEVLSADTLSVDWSISSVEENSTGVPQEFMLNQNFPNPFNPYTMITYVIPISGNVDVSIFNTIGKRVKILVKANQIAGLHSLFWNGQDERGHNVASGLYYYRLNVDGHVVQTRKMVLLR
jgi:lysophospholipase L1-like esterase